MIFKSFSGFVSLALVTTIVRPPFVQCWRERTCILANFQVYVNFLPKVFFFSETPVLDMTRQVETMRVGVATVLHAARTILLGVAKLLFVVRPVVGAAGVAVWPMVHMLHVTNKVLPF